MSGVPIAAGWSHSSVAGRSWSRRRFGRRRLAGDGTREEGVLGKVVVNLCQQAFYERMARESEGGSGTGRAGGGGWRNL